MNEQRQSNITSGTTGSVLFTAISVALALAQNISTPIPPYNTRIQSNRTEGTASEPIFLQVNEVALFNQINRIYDELLKNQIDLDVESKRAIYANRRNLYTR